MIDQTYHDEQTLFKVQEALQGEDYGPSAITSIIGAIQNNGILFRERVSGRDRLNVVGYGDPEPDDEENVTELAEEPVEHRLRRAFANGWREGFDRGAWGDQRWDRS